MRRRRTPSDIMKRDLFALMLSLRIGFFFPKSAYSSSLNESSLSVLEIGAGRLGIVCEDRDGPFGELF
jgi:hypothetical protein